MDKKLKNYATLVAFSVMSILAFNACGDDIVGEPGLNGKDGADGKNGTNGKDGVNGVDGVSCSAKALKDGSGYELSCGGEVVGTIKNGINGKNGTNGTNGLNGNDGTSCSAKALSDHSGYELTCAGKNVGTIKNGENGSNGTSCSATELDDGSGFELKCDDKVVGIIKNGTNGSNGQKGTSCTAEALDDESGFELICDDKVVGTIKNGTNGSNGQKGTSCSAKALDDESGFELTCDDKVVGTIKNGNDGKNGSSCTAKALDDDSGFELKCGSKVVGVIRNGKDVEKERGVGFDAWYYGKNTVDGLCGINHHVVSNALADLDNLDCDDDAFWSNGWWYMGTSGVTTVLWGPDYDEEIVEDPDHDKYFADVYFEVNGSGELVHAGHEMISAWVIQSKPDNWDYNEEAHENGETENFWIGVDLASDFENGSDASGWLGLCVKYMADKPDLRMSVSAVYNGVRDESLSYTLPETMDDGAVINIRWTDFERVDWVPRNEWFSLSKTAQHFMGIRFYYSLWNEAADIHFNIQKIGAYGTCED